MATSLLLLHYNNYYNRTYRRNATVDEYKAADAYYHVCNAVNFVPGDGINAEVTLGFGNNPSNLFDDANCDYCVAFDMQTQSILSRWFIDRKSVV